MNFLFLTLNLQYSNLQDWKKETTANFCKKNEQIKLPTKRPAVIRLNCLRMIKKLYL